MNVLSLFDGMSCGYLALEKSGLKIDNYYAAEIDKHAITVSVQNNPHIKHLGSVTEWTEWDIDWSSIDLLIGGSPCQGFSRIGKQLAFNDPRSALFYTYVDILNHLRSKNPNIKFLLENVKMNNANCSVVDNALGVERIHIDSSDFLPCIRNRYYWCNWDIDGYNKSDLTWKDIPDINLHEGWKPATCKRSVSDGNFVVFTGKKYMNTLTTYSGNANGVGRPFFALEEFEFGKTFPKNNKTKVLTPEQCEFLQGVPIGYTSMVSDSQRYRMLGNGWTVDVISHILSSM